MTRASVARLPERGVIAVTGADAEKLLSGLITNDLPANAVRASVFAGLLSPQGKILFDFFLVRTSEGFLIEVSRAKAPDLVKRLMMYKLRADVRLADVSEQHLCLALWGEDSCSSGETRGTVSYVDPRHSSMGLRILADAQFATDIAGATNGQDASVADYDAHRIGLAVPEGGKDYTFGDTFPHEANFDLMHGVSFTKGCYVGQEIVSRMEHRGTSRKRVVRISARTPLASGTDLKLGNVVIGTVGTVAGTEALALVRLDRVVEAIDKGEPIAAGGGAIECDAEAVAAFRTRMAEKAAHG